MENEGGEGLNGKEQDRELWVLKGKEQYHEFQGLKGKEWGTGDGWVAEVKEESKYGLIDGGFKGKLNILTYDASLFQNIPP